MNAKFVFPPPPHPAPIPRPPRPQKPGGTTAQPSRDSNTLRASVLDVALELGIGSNSLVADWMFNNAVQEEDESEEPLPLKLSASSAFPDSQSPKTLINADASTINKDTRLSPGAASADIDPDVRSTFSVPIGRGIPVAFPDGMPLPPNIPPIPPTPEPSVYSTATVSKNKLKKSRKGDGYESESAYLSEGSRKSKEKEREKEKKKKKAKVKEENLSASTDPEQRKRKRSFVDTVIGRRDKDRDIDLGYATDGSNVKTQKTKKGKSKTIAKDDASEAQYETDGGTKRSKTKSFFKLSGKSSKPDLPKERAITPPVPQLKEQMPLPIAQRFAKASPDNGSNPSLDETRSTMSHSTSLAPTSLDEHRSTMSHRGSLPPAGSIKSIGNEVPPLNLGNLPSLSFQPLAVDVAQPPSPSSTPSQFPSSPASSFPSFIQSPPTIRDSRTSSGSSSSVVSNSQSRTSASVISANISSSFTSPATSHSHIQISSPRTGHGLGTGSTSTTTSVSQHSLGHGHGQTQRVDPFARPSGASRPTSPPSSAAAAAAVAGMMTFQIARDVSTVPLIMRQHQQQNPEPLAQIQDDGQVPSQTHQTIEDEQVETYPRRLSVGLAPTAPLNIAKGGGLRIKPSLERINILGFRKDNREHASAGGTTPSSAPPPATAIPLKPSASMTPSMSGLPTSPMHPLSLQSSRSWNGRPMSPPQSSHSNQTLSPHSFISPPITATPSPAHSTIPSRTPSRTRLYLNPPPPLNSNQLVAPNVLAFYDIPPPSPPPMGPLPLPPQFPDDMPRMSRASSPVPPSRNRSRSPIPPLPPNHNPTLDGGLLTQFPSPAQLRQRMLDRTPRKLPSDETPHGGLAPIVGIGSNANIRRGKESPFPSAPIFQKSPLPAGQSSSGASDESAESGDGFERPTVRPPRSSVMSIQPGPLNNQEKRVLDSVLSRKEEKRSSWIDFGGRLVSDTSEEDVGKQSGECVRDSLDDHGSLPDTSEMRDVLDQLTGSGSRSEESAYSGKALARSRSSEALKPVNSDLPPQNGYAWDDSVTMGDRTSRWSGSIYSRMSIMDEEESNDIRDRFVKRVEAMLAEGGRKNAGDGTERSIGGGGGIARQNSRGGKGRDQYIPPVPKIPDSFVGSPPRRAEVVPTGRLWNKF